MILELIIMEIHTILPGGCVFRYMCVCGNVIITGLLNVCLHISSIP